jgi:hypothetical protein
VRRRHLSHGSSRHGEDAVTGIVQARLGLQSVGNPASRVGGARARAGRARRGEGHRVEANGMKRYDKHAPVVRGETVINSARGLQVRRTTRFNGEVASRRTRSARVGRPASTSVARRRLAGECLVELASLPATRPAERSRQAGGDITPRLIDVT